MKFRKSFNLKIISFFLQYRYVQQYFKSNWAINISVFSIISNYEQI